MEVSTDANYDEGPEAILDAICPICGTICGCEDGTSNIQCFACGYGLQDKE